MDLQSRKEDRWGWLIYRTTYKDDAAWERYKADINKYSQEYFSHYNTPSVIRNALDWTFISDPVYDGASREDLRRYFREWRRTAGQAENPRRDPALGLDPDHLSQRYLFFVQVDEESLNSIIENPDGRPGSWVHFICCWDEDNNGVRPRDLDEGIEDDGWMMIFAHTVYPEFYEAIGTTMESWTSFYMPPPSVVDW